MADTLQPRNSTVVKNLRDRLAAWDAKVDPIAPLSEKQKDGFIELTTLSGNRGLPVEVRLRLFRPRPLYLWALLEFIVCS